MAILKLDRLFSVKSKLLLLVLFFFYCISAITQTTYTENFTEKGYPSNLPENAYWKFYNDIHPEQTNWNKFIPGDGNAYITVDADITNDTDDTYPYQTLVFGGVSENHRLEVRMKGAAVDGGLAAFIFTYHQEGTIFNEVDIEVVAQDGQSPTSPHEIYAPNGWTDARFNTWRNADEITTLPFSGSQKPVVDKDNKRISLIDDEFHTYTIDWKEDQVDFFIDEVLQESFTSNIATGWSEVIIGYRNLPWAGDFNWTGEHTMVIDYFKIEPLLNTLFTNSFNNDDNQIVRLFPNPTKDKINIEISEDKKIRKMELMNVLSSKIIHLNNFNSDFNSSKEIDISNFAKGIYFLNVVLESGKTITKKIVKL
ncbi:MAG: T9SS type A sorting domain-containing protein [Polaribacter sp.]|uniref:T9SS type A sorting domain-containing protein n=1 Tax=Polaribacter sp. TaxID=1920175 RepID=UPI003BAF56CB